MCELDGMTSDGHLWSSPARAGDACGCGEMVIVSTVETGTRNGLSVVSWKAARTDEAAGGEAKG